MNAALFFVTVHDVTVYSTSFILYIGVGSYVSSNSNSFAWLTLAMYRLFRGGMLWVQPIEWLKLNVASCVIHQTRSLGVLILYFIICTFWQRRDCLVTAHDVTALLWRYSAAARYFCGRLLRNVAAFWWLYSNSYVAAALPPTPPWIGLRLAGVYFLLLAWHHRLVELWVGWISRLPGSN